MKILIAEDDEYLSDAISLGLEHSGYSVHCVSSGIEAKGALYEGQYDLLLLDLGLPDIDGIRVLKDIRQNGHTLPVIIITARDTIEDKINGLDQGANDYMTKPFDIRELNSRIRGLLRKTYWGNRLQMTNGRLRVDTSTREVFLDDEPVKLTAGEVSIIEGLMKQPGRLVGKNDLVERLAKWDTVPTDNAIEIVVHRLRKKLAPGGIVIRTVRGLGYVLERQNESVDS